MARTGTRSSIAPPDQFGRRYPRDCAARHPAWGMGIVLWQGIALGKARLQAYRRQAKVLGVDRRIATGAFVKMHLDLVVGPWLAGGIHTDERQEELFLAPLGAADLAAVFHIEEASLGAGAVHLDGVQILVRGHRVRVLFGT